MKKSIVLLYILSSLSLNLFSQEYDPYTYQDIKPKPAINEKFFFGGGFGLQFGTFTVIKITPDIGYRVNEHIELGIGGYYMYTDNIYYNFSDHVWGANVFTRLFVYQNFYLQAEYEWLNIADFDYTTGFYTGERIYIPGFLGGIGFRQKIGERAAIYTSILYNFTMTVKTPYSNPVFKISIVF